MLLVGHTKWAYEPRKPRGEKTRDNTRRLKRCGLSGAGGINPGDFAAIELVKTRIRDAVREENAAGVTVARGILRSQYFLAVDLHARVAG